MAQNASQAQIASFLQQNFGYLSAADLSQWCDVDLLVSRQNRLPNGIVKAVAQGISEATDRLRNVYDLSQELSKQDTLPGQATVAIAAGSISAVNLISPGTNYVQAPTISLTNAAGDTGAGGVLTAEVSDSVISAIDLLNPGEWYNQPPIISFVGGGGVGAAATCTLDNWKRIASITLISGGTGWTSIPQIVFTPVDGFGRCAAAVASVKYGQLTGITITNPGAGYAAAPTINIVGGQNPDTRNQTVVKIMSIYAVRNAMGGAQNVSEHMIAIFKMADEMIEDLRNGQNSTEAFSATKKIYSSSGLIQDQFRMIG